LPGENIFLFLQDFPRAAVGVEERQNKMHRSSFFLTGLVVGIIALVVSIAQSSKSSKN